jgi:hypothetical protein
MSPGSADQVVNEIRNGATLSDVIRNTADGVSTNLGAMGEGTKAYADALPTGRHWNGPVWSEADVAALKRFGSRIGDVGTAIDMAIAYYDWKHGEPVRDVVTEFGGSALGSAVGGWIAGGAGGSLAGPEGALIGGFLGAVIGGLGGGVIGRRIGH